MSNVLKLILTGIIGLIGVIILPNMLKNNKSINKTTEVSVVLDATVLSVSKYDSLSANKKTVKILNIDKNRTILISGEISDDVIEISNKIKQLNDESKNPIYIVLYSPGGSVLAGSQVINAMETSRAPIYTVCKVLCASMAAIIHQYGTKRYMFDRSIIMFHQASAGTQGSIGQMNAMLGMLTRYIYKTESEVAKRWGISLAEYQQRTASEYWLDSQEALAANVADGLVDFDTTGLMPVRRSVPSDSKQALPTYVETRLNTFKW